MAQFCLPDLGEGLTSAEIVSWLVAVGDVITVDQVVVEVETAKASVEVPAPFAGTVRALHGGPGDTVDVGAPLITVETSTTETPAIETPTTETGATVEAAAPDESGRVLVGYGTRVDARPSTRRRARSAPRPPSRRVTQLADQPPAGSRSSAGVISPLVRRLAREHGLDASTLAGTGSAGVVLRRDVESALAAGSSGHRIPLTGVRAVAAERLSRSRREIPEATVWVDVDATDLLAARAALNAARPAEPVSLLALLARFTVLGLRRFPELNGRLENGTLVLFDEVHLGFAAQTERGLVVPVLADAHRLSTRGLAAALRARTDQARAGTLAPGQLRGGTFTVNNYGVFGVDGSAAIINHPELAILGLGRIIDRPWVVDGEVAIRKLTQLTLAFDHRACDGAVAGGFLRFVADCIESPVTALGDL